MRDRAHTGDAHGGFFWRLSAAVIPSSCSFFRCFLAPFLTRAADASIYFAILFLLHFFPPIRPSPPSRVVANRLQFTFGQRTRTQRPRESYDGRAADDASTRGIKCGELANDIARLRDNVTVFLLSWGSEQSGRRREQRAMRLTISSLCNTGFGNKENLAF